MKAEISMADVIKSVTINVRVRGFLAFNVRKAFGLWLIKLGVRVIGCRVNVDDRPLGATDNP